MSPVVWFVASVTVVAFAAGWVCCEFRRRELADVRIDETVARLHEAFADGPTVTVPRRCRLRLVSPGPYDWQRDGA